MQGYSLTYIYHDCFVYENEAVILIFDYWKDPLAPPEGKDFPPFLKNLDRNKFIYVFVSHHHKDHFSRRIFLWAREFPNISYIISPDVFKAVKYMLSAGGTYSGYQPPSDKVFVLSPGESYQDDLLKVKAFPSTDIGNAYAISCYGKIIFHAGDLNAWLWIDESTNEEIEEARKSYTSIVNDIQKEFPYFDLVMFPVDSRLGREYWWGAKYFVDHISTALFVPMHFELVLAEEDKIPRRIDASAFNSFARSDFGAYVQLAASRSRYLTTQ